jgi:hypothetical protein
MHGEENTPGILTLKGRDSGFDNIQNWYVMYLENDTMLAYYCGDLMTWHFEGVLVMSKTVYLNEKRVPDLTRALAKISLTFDDLCALSPSTGCSNHPAPFPPYST